MDYKKILWEKIKLSSKNIESSLHPLERKRTGSYYTPFPLTNLIMKELVCYLLHKNQPIWNYRFLEPCAGTGNFIFSYLHEISKLSLNSEQIQCLLSNIYIAEIYSSARNEYQTLLKEFVKIYWNIELEESYFTKHIKTGLLIDVTKESPSYLKITDVFENDILKDGFDIVVTNPPYKNLKAEKEHYIDEYNYQQEKIKYTEIAKLVSKNFKYAVNGTLNLYKIFVEEIIDNYTNNNACICLLIPSSILSDKTCEKLRTHILMDMQLKSIKIIGEKNGLSDAQQALSTFFIQKGCTTDTISIQKGDWKNPESSVTVAIQDIINPSTGNAIFALSKTEYPILQKIRSHPTIKDLPFIINLRGELDLTANKKYIVNQPTTYPLLRGRNIGYYQLVDLKQCEYVSEDFLLTTKKLDYIQRDRIICQQISNIHKKRRITFAKISKNYILGNSCNFIAVNPNPYGITIYTLLGLLNTKIINWLFQLTSSNNHINNYEIDCFPIPVSSDKLPIITQLAMEYEKSQDPVILDKIEQYTAEAYHITDSIKQSDLTDQFFTDLKFLLPNLSRTEAEEILKENKKIQTYPFPLSEFNSKVAECIIKKYQKILSNEVINHTTFKLSELDLEMIKSVPQGGNWKDIPQETIQKSKRLTRITQTGGRTTLYGRIDYTKPSYTITTYFNRPGNGTYIHPVKERVLSVREAARFQCFPDHYIFFGSKTDLLKQVGNAVPVLLAYQIGKAIKEKTGCCTSIDLFSGAGGMTYGFKLAGIHTILANDISENACITLKANSPEIPVLCGDITNSEIKTKIILSGKSKKADIICGGPPCQGFSMAGFRKKDDPRNQLFQDFVTIVSEINPKIIIFENVEGILSYQGGETYQNIIELFSKLGYSIEGRKLMASDYGIPQKRKRVILLCTRKDISIPPKDIFPLPITPNKEQQISAYETIYDLENVECNENAKYSSSYTSAILNFLKGNIKAEQYLKLITDPQKITEKELLYSL